MAVRSARQMALASDGYSLSVEAQLKRYASMNKYKTLLLLYLAVRTDLSQLLRAGNGIERGQLQVVDAHPDPETA
jgi:hypothetical protein